ncbi:MAG: tetratricopeptide repeat protein [Chthoniobacterales bacterium]
MNPRNLFAELKRRSVYRVAIGYGIAAWLVVQIASTVLPTFHVPEWLLQALIVLVALGFPVALVLAWAFDVTPFGIEKTADRAPGSADVNTRHGWLIAIAGLIVAAAASATYLIWHPWRAPQRTSISASVPIGTSASEQQAIPQKSIAVLPFENLSEEKSNAYFAEGIQDEILTRLAKIADLKVISHTSTQHYKSAPENLPQIAKQLGVANILEGSVQKAGDSVRVNVQLINAQTDSNLWAETYDRKLADIFAVESEIAKGIAESLQAKLTGREEQALAVKSTSNPAAYDAYLRGLAFEARNYSYSTSTDLAYQATDSYERAGQLDPSFAVAWARLSRADALIYFNCEDTTCAARGGAAKRALENAQKLEPNSPETLLALGHYQYLVLRDYGAAKTTFARVSTTLPGSSDVPRALGSIARREGHWDESIAYFEQALALDPRNVVLVMRAAWTYGMLRRFPTALKLYDRALDITPNDRGVMAAKAAIYQAQGNLKEAASLLSEVNEQSPSGETFAIKIGQLRLERNYGEAIRLLEARLAQPRFNSESYNKVALAFMLRLAGDAAGAKVTAEQRVIRWSSSIEMNKATPPLPQRLLELCL